MAEKKITVRDLQTFIEAVEFASDQDEWTPSPRQWKRIKEMIEVLEEAPPPAPPVVQPRQPQPAYGPPAYSGPPLSSTLGGAVALPQPSGPVPFAAGPQPVKTPDIDTSNGTYKSTFA